ncbi:phosphomannomutase/phosphoglucomutase [Simiduia agarivorans]|uniref:phosphomannomutase n=1 Tax=Simiduia agarivorans (strain DSM 21679 / JCM 13881 / BCRC 17597 / SA1) TaxID=1117647 RepID=K4L0P9_SIMAS|nr:phosphomannomutase/phosphoglucomutase [Simiduia agarivorans]AFU99712.1 phosphomannomutase [Simiduia agarivorans SA1 = DSM 21679]
MTKSKAPAPQAKTAKPGKTAPKQPPYFLLLSVASMLICGLLAWVGYQLFVASAEQSNLRTLADVELKKRVGAVSQWIQATQADVAAFGARDALATAVAYQEMERVEEYRRAVAKTFTGSESVQFFPRGSVQLNPEGNPPINFIQMDLINQAEARESTLPEAVKMPSGWFIQIATGLPTDKEKPALGTMLLTLNMQALRTLLAAQNNEHGSTSLIQRFGTIEQTFFTSGNGEVDLVVTEAIPDSNWQVSFKPSYTLANRASVNPIPFLGGCVVLLAILIAISAWLSRFIIQHKEVQQRAKAREKAMMATKGTREQKDLDVKVKEEDKSLLGMDKDGATQESPAAPQVAEVEEDDGLSTIFRAYDIRGVVGQALTPAFAESLGRALGTEALEQGESTLFVGRDGRIHSEELSINLVNGILSTGCNVINLGLIPSPLLYYACLTNNASQSGVIVTASHNPGEYNGFKMVIGGKTLTNDAIKALYTRIKREQFRQGAGVEQHENIADDYVERIFSDVALAADVKLVIDAGNGATGDIAPRLFEELGCFVETLYCDIDGRFPNHNPDPSRPENLKALIAKVKSTNADLGVAFDGDGDRLTVVTPKGQIIWPDRLLMLFARDIVSRNPGADVLFDVKSTRQLNSLITSYGGRPIMWKTGHSNMKQKMAETGALLGGELSGHIFIKDRWYGFDDGMYATARLLEIMTLRDQDIDSIFEAFPSQPSTPEILVPIDEHRKFDVINKLVAQGNFQGGKLTTIDGLRVDFAKGWGLARASNTQPALTLRFEGDNEETLAQLQALFKRELKKVDPNLELGF